MKKGIALLCLLWLGNSVLYAQQNEFQSIATKLIEVSQIDDDAERLSEYDLLAEEARFLIDRLRQETAADNETEDEEAVPEDTGDWRTQVQTNPLDDTKTIAAILEADKGTNRHGQKPTIIAMCRSGKVDFYINWGEQLGEQKEVTFRIGEQDSQSMEWILSTDAQASFYPSETVESFLAQLRETERFVAQITPTNSMPITAIFDVSGASAVIPQVLACGE